MSSLQAHLWQARHNESLASELLADLSYKDWAVTVTFYAALHYVEAAFAKDLRIQHTETSKPRGFKGSFHAWREDCLFRLYPKEVMIPFRKLREQCRTARYLATKGPEFLKVSTQEYFSDEDVRAFFQRDLETIRQTLGFA